MVIRYRGVTSTLAAATLLVLLGTPTAGSDPLTQTRDWVRKADGPVVWWSPAAFARSSCELVVFGGNVNGLVGATWLFDPAADRWTKLAASRSGPAARDLSGLAWDPDRKRIVLFGGRAWTGPLADSWTFDPATRSWSPLITNCRKATCPSPRLAHGFLWSRTLGGLVAFGGQGANDTPLGDMWVLRSGWSKVDQGATRPSPRYLFGLAEDASSGQLVLYGGLGEGMSFMNDTWLFDPATRTWTEVRTPTQPPAFGEVAMGWSPSVGAVVMTGGDGGGCAPASHPGTWAFDRAKRDWVRLDTSGGPPTPRNAATLTADTCRDTAILHGGTDTRVPRGFEDATWVLR